MLRRRTPLLWPALACVLSVSVALPAVATDATTDESTPAGTASSPDPLGPVPRESDVAQHSSDVTEPVLTARRGGASSAWFDVAERTRPVAPGLDHTRFDRYDIRGWVRVNTLTADLSVPGLRLDYTAPGKVSSPGPLSTALRRTKAVAGVNGDFFDIGDTGAPLGVGVDRQRGLIHGSVSGWNNAFTLDRDNVAAVARTFLQATVVRRGKRDLQVTDLNAPEIRPGGIGLYTAAWGADSRYRVLPDSGPRREVVVAAATGRVRANRKTLSSGPIPGDLIHLVGTGEGAKRLRGLAKGTRVSVEYGLDQDAVKVAVGGNVVLLRDGKVLAPGDLEMHPRTAIGIDRDLNRIIILAVDGRQWHSRGLTMKETATLLKRLGAEDGLNLDGGGSSTMMAREAGEDLGVVNSPSDGRLRSVPNGLELVFAKGSGNLTGIRVEPLWDLEESNRVLRGLSRVLVARGHDESYAPVGVRPSWKGSPNASARPGPGRRTVVVGRRKGVGTVTASAGGARGEHQIRVLGPVHRLEASVPTIALSGRGRSAVFDLRGYDAEGFGTWVEPRDVRLSYDRDELALRRTGRGFTVTARVRSAADVVTVSAGGQQTHIGVTVGLARQRANGMNRLSDWETSAYPRRADSSLSMIRNRKGAPGRAVAMRYALYGKKATRAAFLTATEPLDLPARARRIGAWVRGDGKGAWLRAMVRDAGGSTSTVNLARRVTWKGWRFVAADLPPGLAQPLRFVRFHAVETDRRRKYAGVLGFDDLTVFTERVPTVPDTDPLRDPMVADLAPLEPGGLRVAVLADAGISAAAPRSKAVARTRRAMREIVAAKPGLVIINGDLVARGDRADMDLARRVITEELGGKVAWHYVPGDREIGSGGDLSGFRAEFGEPLRVQDEAGTRFVLMNSAQGAFRLSGFYQMVRLRAELKRAGTDPSVRSVVVVAHHPTSDPAAGGTAELADPREGALVEELLSDFRADSGKTVAYVGAHARRFGVTRRDGVAHVLAGPVRGSAPARTGSFTGWSMLRLDGSPEAGMTAEFRPQTNALRIAGPNSLTVGDRSTAFATLRQDGRRLRVGYPMNAVWSGSVTVHVGSAETAPVTAVVAYDPGTRRITALRRGVAELRVRVNGVTASRTVTVE